MSDLTLYHNPRCSKSRATLELLRERELQPRVIEYLETPPDRAELKRLLEVLGIGPRELLRTGETEYRELGLADTGLGDEALIEAMVTHPRLIQRPILIQGDRAVIGRPPERVLEIIG